MAETGTPSPNVGFLTVIENEPDGLFGGLLVLNPLGRPVEFHCTLPVRPSRAQEILFGPTLQPYLYGEQIGNTLLSKAKAKPVLVCTDVEPVLALRGLVELPVYLVQSSLEADRTVAADGEGPQEKPSSAGQSAAGTDSATDFATGAAAAIAGNTTASSGRQMRLDPDHRRPQPSHGMLIPFKWGGYQLAVGDSYRGDIDRLESAMRSFADRCDLLEPFARIRDAMDEARGSSR